MIGADQPGGLTGEQCITEAGPDDMARNLLRLLENVGHDLRPQTTLRAATHSDEPARDATGLVHRFEVVPYAAGDSFQNSAVEMPAGDGPA